MSIRYLNAYELGWVTDDHAFFRERGACYISTNGIVRFSQFDPQSYNRKSGPARIEVDGQISYHRTDGKIHRTDGPAIIRADGTKEYWVNSVKLQPDEFFLKYGLL